MKTGNAYLPARLATRSFLMADMFTITLLAGSVIRLTSADIALMIGGFTFAPAVIKRTRTRVTIGIKVDTMTLTINPGNMTLLGNQFIKGVHAGALDGATVKVERVFLESWDNTATAGIVNLFEGEVGEPVIDGTKAVIPVKSVTHLLNIKMPRNLFLPSCGRTLYRSGCDVNKSSFASAGIVTAGATKTAIPAGLEQAVGYFDQGYLIFTSGPNSGVTRTIKAHSTNLLTLALPLAFAPNAGDTFTVYPGCDRTIETCTTKFNNKPKFRGFKYIPVPETAY